MHADAPKLLWDAQQAVERIARFTQGKTWDDYQGDELLRAAVERQFEILGEALGRLRRIDAGTAQAVAELPRMVAFRNVLTHGYATVDDRLVWGIVQAHLEPLRGVLAHLLES